MVVTALGTFFGGPVINLTERIKEFRSEMERKDCCIRIGIGIVLVADDVVHFTYNVLVLLG